MTTKGVTGLYVDFSDLLMKITTSIRPDADMSKESVLTPYADAELIVLDLVMTGLDGFPLPPALASQVTCSFVSSVP